MFRASVTIQVGDGTTARFWTDAWLLDGAICCFAPNLFWAVGSRRRNRCVKDVLANRQWARDITGAPTATVLIKYVQLCDKIEGVQLRPHIPDRLIWKWTAGSE
jgi:hypothetical protein